jgi:hypothetical protein
MTIYQTKKTKEILERIQNVSDVRWNSGCLPTIYCDKEMEYINISYEAFENFTAMTLWESDRYSGGTINAHLINCTDDEFVEHCKRMRPKTKQGD